MFAKKNKKKDIGRILVGFAVLMTGMTLMSDSVDPLANSPDFQRVLTAFHNPILGVLVGTVFTGIIQSSAGSIGILQAFSKTGGLTWGMSLPIIMGCNIGTCVTALLSTVGVSKDAKRVAWTHIIIKIIGTLVLLPIIMILQNVVDLSIMNKTVGYVGIAVMHTIFNVATTVMFMPFTKQLVALSKVVVRDGKEEVSFETKYEGCNPVADSLLGIKYVLDDPIRTNSASKVDASYIKFFSKGYKKDKNVDATMDVYENPNALSIGFMASNDILRLSALGNDNPFNSLNNFLSAMAGSTEDFVDLTPRQYYVPLDYTVKFDDSKVNFHEYNHNGTIHDCYESFPGVDDVVVNVDITVPKTGDIYMHLGSEVRNEINVWAAVKDKTDGVYKGQKTGNEYFDGYGVYFNKATNASPVVRFGPFKAGDEVEIRLTIPPKGAGNVYTGSDEYMMIRQHAGFNYYYLDEAAFKEDIDKLKANSWNLDMSKTNDRHLVGDVDVQEGQMLVTSIPYEPGWEVQIDGKTVPSQIIEEKDKDTGTVTIKNDDGAEGAVVVLGALMGIRVPAGHHTVSMKYTPPGFNLGLVLLVFGIIALVAIWLYDRKHNKVIIESIKGHVKTHNDLIIALCGLSVNAFL